MNTTCLQYSDGLRYVCTVLLAEGEAKSMSKNRLQSLSAQNISLNGCLLFKQAKSVSRKANV